MENNEIIMKEKKQKPVLQIIIVALVAVILVMNAVFAIFQIRSNQKLSLYIDDDRKYNLKQTSDEYIEDGFVVGDQYEIRSTKKISDAFLAGSPEGLEENDAKTYELAAAVISEVITPEMGNYEKALAIYEWMCANIETSDGSSLNIPGTTQAEAVSTPYGVLTGKKSVCVGYATTMRLFMNMLGVDCHIVHNDYHSWDLIQMDDGTWYHTDIYSDSSTGNHANFNMTDSMARSGHEWNDRGFLPAADAYTYCYAYKNAVALEDISTVPQTVFDLSHGNHNSFSLYYLVDITDEIAQVKATAIMDMISTIFNSDMIPETEEKYFSYYWQDIDDNTKLLVAVLNDYSDNGNNSDDHAKEYNETLSEYQDMINELFGTYIEFREWIGRYETEEPVEEEIPLPIEGEETNPDDKPSDDTTVYESNE